MNLLKYSCTVIILLVSLSTHGQQASKQYLEEQRNEKIEKINRDGREELKSKIKAINDALLAGDISVKEADSLKIKYAEQTAIEIKEKSAAEETQYYENKFELEENFESEPEMQVSPSIHAKERKNYISNDLVFAFGLNNLLEENVSLEDSPYEFAKSYFIELGWSWKTNLVPRSDLFNIRYGFSFQFNSLQPKDNGIFTTVNDQIQRSNYVQPLKRNRLMYTNFVIPIHLELGSKRKHFTTATSNRNYFMKRYRQRSLIFGFGIYGGVHVDHMQKIKGNDFKERIKNDLDFTNLIYGLSGYFSFPRMFTLYAKTDLSPLFRNQPQPQKNISLGMRFDIF